jgi:hypothetical protein
MGAPDRIWLDEHHGAAVDPGDGTLRPLGHDGEPAEYLRADLARAELERLREGIRAAMDDTVRRLGPGAEADAVLRHLAPLVVPGVLRDNGGASGAQNEPPLGRIHNSEGADHGS